VQIIDEFVTPHGLRVWYVRSMAQSNKELND